MHRDFNVKLPLWEGDVFGRLTPPPDDDIEMEREFFAFKPSVLEEQNSEPAMECLESSLLDLEFESICSGEFDGFKSGPTLAELNETRSRSPLINPEMKRLHQVAIRTVGETSEKSCESALLLQTKSHSVLEQQLRTQPSTSISYEQFFPSRKDGSEQLPSTVNRSEPIRIPGRDIRTPHTEHSSVPLSPPSQERKVFVDGYKAQSTSSQLISPQFENNYSVPNEGYGIISPSSSSTAAHSFRAQHSHRSVSCEQISENRRSAKDETTTDQYDISDDDEFESDDEVDDAEEYCPTEKDGKIPTRRKGRKSESEDMVPNPTKLLNIGRELDRLNKIISDLKPINELPQHSRGRSRKEKNKLASRACRLKKKQQHEANKVKLHGLESEQENLTFIVNNMKHEIVSWARLPRKPADPLNEKFQNMAKKALSQQIAGHTTEFVRKVLQEVAKGNQTGGLCLSKRSEQK